MVNLQLTALSSKVFAAWIDRTPFWENIIVPHLIFGLIISAIKNSI
jgi:hypothetical protein